MTRGVPHLLTVWLLMCWMAVAAQAPSAVQLVTLNQASVSVAGHSQAPEPVNLPYHWDRQHPGLGGAATFELAFDLPQVPDEPFGLYLPRLGNAYEMWLNGKLLQRRGDLLHGNGADYAKVPRYLVISPGLLVKHNLLRIHIRADVGRRAGLTPMVIGPADPVNALYLSDYRARSTGSMAVVIVSLVLLVMTLALWVSQVNVDAHGRRRDPLYAYAALAEFFWIFRVGDVLLENPPLPWPWWSGLSTLAVAGWISSLILFCIEVAGWSRLVAAKRLRVWLLVLVVLSFVGGTLAPMAGQPVALTLLYVLLMCTASVFAVVLIWKALRHASHLHQVVAAILLLNILVGVRDLWAFRFSQSFGGNTYLRYSALLFGLMLMYVVMVRFRTASALVRDNVTNLAATVAQREQELGASHAQLEKLAREQERTSERTRILRDMHDGVGAHISTAIRQLESGQASPDEVLHTLRDSLDQLKLSVDAMHLAAGDITALLAGLRYRLEPRLRASGIALHWDVDLLPVLEDFDDKAMRHVQYMVFEAVSNVLQHAHASTLAIELRRLPQGGAQLRVTDNGCGFKPDQVKRQGLNSLQDRAVALGAGLRISSAPGKTVLEITLHQGTHVG